MKLASQRLLASLSAFDCSNFLRVNFRVYLSPKLSESSIGGNANSPDVSLYLPGMKWKPPLESPFSLDESFC